MRLFCILNLTTNSLTYGVKCSCRFLNYRYNVTKYVNADNIMNRKSKSLFTLTGVTLSGLATVAILSLSHGSINDRGVFCGHLKNVVMDQQLPVSHPKNRCANGAVSGGKLVCMVFWAFKLISIPFY